MEKVPCLQDAEVIVGLLMGLIRQFSLPDDPLAARLPLAQLRVCGILGAGPRSMSSLSRELGVSVSAMTQIADRLEHARLAQRIAGQSDRRVKWLRLTRLGERTMRHRETDKARRILLALRRLPARTRSQVLGGLRALSEAFAATIDAGAVNDRSSPRIPAATAGIQGAHGRSTILGNAGLNKTESGAQRDGRAPVILKGPSERRRSQPGRRGKAAA